MVEWGAEGTMCLFVECAVVVCGGVGMHGGHVLIPDLGNYGLAFYGNERNSISAERLRVLSTATFSIKELLPL